MCRPVDIVNPLRIRLNNQHQPPSLPCASVGITTVEQLANIGVDETTAKNLKAEGVLGKERKMADSLKVSCKSQ